MNISVLNTVLTKFINKSGSIDRLTELKRQLNYGIGYSGIFDAFLDSRLVIGYESIETYNENVIFSSENFYTIQEKKRRLEYNYDKAYIVRDFIYPAVVYRPNDNDAIWIRNKTIHVFTGEQKDTINFSSKSEYSVSIENFSKEDLFGIKLISTIDINESELYDAINCYQLLKKENFNILFDIR